MEQTEKKKSKVGGFFLTLALLCVPMLVMFNRSLEPNMVLFANDGPLGILMAQFEQGAAA